MSQTACFEMKCQEIAKQLKSAKAEIRHLTVKSDILDKRCIEQITEYREQHLKLQYNFNQQQEQYMNTIETMTDQIKNQQIKLESLQQELHNAISLLQAQTQQNQTIIDDRKNRSSQKERLSALSNTNKQLKIQIETKTRVLDQTVSALQRANFEMEMNKLRGNVPDLHKQYTNKSDSNKHLFRIAQFTPIPNNPITPYTEMSEGTHFPLFALGHSNATIASQGTDTSDQDHDKHEHGHTGTDSIMPNLADLRIGTIEEHQESTPIHQNSNVNNLDGFEFVLSYQSTEPDIEEPSAHDGTDPDPNAVIERIKKEYEGKYKLKMMDLQREYYLAMERLKAPVEDNDDDESMMIVDDEKVAVQSDTQYEIDELCDMLSDDELFGSVYNEQTEIRQLPHKMDDYLHVTASVVKQKYAAVKDVQMDDLIEKVKRLPFYEYHDEMVNFMEKKIQKRRLMEMNQNKCGTIWTLFGVLT